MVESKNKRGRPLSSQISLERHERVKNLPLHIKARINERKNMAVEALKKIPQGASKNANKKILKKAKYDASMTPFTEFKLSLDKWWVKFCRDGYTQEYVDGLECMERGLKMSQANASRFLLAEKKLVEQQKSNSLKAANAVNARWSNDSKRIEDRDTARQVFERLTTTQTRSSLSVRGRAMWLHANWPYSDKPSLRSLQRYVNEIRCANTKK